MEWAWKSWNFEFRCANLDSVHLIAQFCNPDSTFSNIHVLIQALRSISGFLIHHNLLTYNRRNVPYEMGKSPVVEFDNSIFALTQA